MGLRSVMTGSLACCSGTERKQRLASAVVCIFHLGISLPARAPHTGQTMLKDCNFSEVFFFFFVTHRTENKELKDKEHKGGPQSPAPVKMITTPSKSETPLTSLYLMSFDLPTWTDQEVHGAGKGHSVVSHSSHTGTEYRALSESHWMQTQQPSKCQMTVTFVLELSCVSFGGHY